jgi:endoglucanase
VKSFLRFVLILAVVTSIATPFVQAAAGADPATAKFSPVDPFEQAKAMQRGVNIIGYDPIWKNFENRRFKQQYFQALHEAGFQTVRVNLQAFQHMDEMNRLSPAWFKTLDWVVDNALANHLTVILDEHDYEPCGGDAVMCREKLISFWEQVAPRYKNAPSSVVFEILNEPNKALTVETWNSLLKDSLAIIRRTNPQRNVVIGPSSWNSIHELKTLDLPKNDHNIIVTVHYYSPMTFTHQGAKWNKETAQLSGIKWGTDEEKQAIVKDFSGVQEWSKANDRPILLGEFGAYDKGEMDSRVKYTAYVARTAEKMGWAWTYWQFDSDFVVYDIDKEEWVEPIRKALLP